jgi:DNA-binding response OmpR family regulator
MRLLLVEDDYMLGSSLKKGLEFERYSTEWVQTGEDASAALEVSEFDLAILDLNLPDCSGIDVLQRLRRLPKTQFLPVLLLTAMDNIDQKVKGLDAGADDYLTKPFDLQELLARLRAMCRRRQGQVDNILRAGDLELNMHTKQLSKLGVSYLTTASEFKIMSLLMQRPGKLISKSRMEEELYGWDGDTESNTIEVTIYNLRKKLGKDAIVTLRGVGYMVNA